MIQEWWLQVGLSTERLELLKNSTVHKVDFECELGGFKNGHSAELFVSAANKANAASRPAATRSCAVTFKSAGQDHIHSTWNPAWD